MPLAIWYSGAIKSAETGPEPPRTKSRSHSTSSLPPTLAAPDGLRWTGGIVAWSSSASDGRRGTAESDSERGGEASCLLPRRTLTVEPSRLRSSAGSNLSGCCGEIDLRRGRSSSPTAGARCRMSSCVGDGSTTAETTGGTIRWSPRSYVSQAASDRVQLLLEPATGAGAKEPSGCKT
jgi:hypothetical protein